jgi:RimJ/RimL family protein N-acetyltransferase
VFVPPDFVIPLRLETPRFRLEPLGPEHNDADYGAWSSSMEHIRATPGWEESSWPRAMSLEENRADLQRHADDFENRSGFTDTVLEPEGDVVGCVYIYPLSNGSQDARVLSWVRASRADLDAPLWQAVSDWLATEWPFENVDYTPRNASRPTT